MDTRMVITGPGMIVRVPSDIRGDWTFVVLCASDNSTHVICAKCDIPIEAKDMTGVSMDFNQAQLENCCREMDVIEASKDIIATLLRLKIENQKRKTSNKGVN